MLRHKHAERTVAMFAIVIVLAGVIGLVRGSGPAWAAILVGIAMLVVTEWVVWRR